MAVVGWALLLVLAVVLLALCIPVRLAVRYRSGEPAEAWLRWLFLRFDLTELGKHKQAQGQAEGHPRPEKKREKAQREPLEFSQLLGVILDLLASIRGGAGLLVRNFRIYRVRLHLVVAAEDAAETAIRFGKVNAGVYSAYAVAQQLFNLERPDISIRPDFTSEKGLVDFAARGRVLPVVVLAAAIRIGAAFLVKTIQRRTQNRQTNPQGPEASST